MTNILTTATHQTAVIPAADVQAELESDPGLGTGLRTGVVRPWPGPARVAGAALQLRGDRRGITTVEYVIGIIAGITLVGVLILALTNPSVQHAIVGLVTHIFGEGASVKPGVPSGGKS